MSRLFHVGFSLSVLDGDCFSPSFNLVSRVPTSRHSKVGGVTRGIAHFGDSAGNCLGFLLAWRAWARGAFPQPAFRVRRSCTGRHSIETLGTEVYHRTSIIHIVVFH